MAALGVVALGLGFWVCALDGKASIFFAFFMGVIGTAVIAYQCYIEEKEEWMKNKTEELKKLNKQLEKAKKIHNEGPAE